LLHELRFKDLAAAGLPVTAIKRAGVEGILAWAVRGCLEWQETGLLTPESVEAATAAYRKEQDRVRQFLEDECILVATAQVGKQKLYDAYSQWCKDGNIHPVNRTNFNSQLEEKGYKEGRNKEVRYWVGIGLPLAVDEVDF
jgi:putative DNA primase/helicase